MIDHRYGVIKQLLEAGAIKKFTDIFDWIPHSVVAKDFRTSNSRMKKMSNDITLWKLEEVDRLAEIIGYSKMKLAFMAMKEAGKEDPGA
jgi:hypothetical protein